MNENESPITLQDVCLQYLDPNKPIHHISRLLFDMGFSQTQQQQLCALWDSERDLHKETTEAWRRCADLQARTDDLVQCNPVFLLLDAIRDNLMGLENCIHNNLSNLAPYPLHRPDSITPNVLDSILGRLRPLVQADLTHYQAVLINLYGSLKLAHNVLDKYCPEQADDDDADDHRPPAGSWGPPPDPDDD